MAYTILGIFIALVPFIFISRRSFLSIVAVVATFHIVVAVATQAFHVFTYPVILQLNSLAAVICLVVYLIIIRKKDTAVDGIHMHHSLYRRLRPPVVALVAFIIVFCELFSVHYHYTGITADVRGMDAVVNSSYPYPYYSDEWVGVAFTEYSIRNHSLPLVNPLDADKPFANPLVVFYATVAEFFLLVHLNPLTGWAILALINGLIVCVLIYKIVRGLGASPFAASVAMLSVPLIVNATNAPGIWFFVPFLGSLTVLVAGLALIIKNEQWFAVLAACVALALYPPMIIFIFPAALTALLKNRYKINRIVLAGFFVMIPTGGIAALLLATVFGITETWDLLTGWIVRSSLDGGIPALAIWHIIPLPLIALSCIGFGAALRQKLYFFIFPAVVGLSMWVIYAFVPDTFIIDYMRVVPIVSILLMVFVGLGVEVVVGFFSTMHRRSMQYVKIGVIACFAALALLYPLGSNWAKLVLVMQTSTGVATATPSAPVNRYLHQADLDLFRSIHGQFFLSPPWTGLVVGVATHNYPLDSKSSTVANHIVSYDDFMKADCTTKNIMATEAKAAYVYSTYFSCPQFEKVGGSSAHLILYRHI